MTALVLFGLVFAAALAFAVLPLPGMLPILMYHFIGTEEDAAREKNFVTLESFKRQIEFLHRFGYRVISLDDYYEILTGRRKPRGREILLTFDDGNDSFLRDAFPVLARYEYPVALFLVSESMKKGINTAMPIKDIKQLMAYPWITVAAHTRTHPTLTALSETRMEDEIAGSKKDLEAMLGIPIHYFAYPYGEFDERVIEVTKKAGYRLAFTTSYKKFKTVQDGPYAVTRNKISRTSDNLLVFWFKLSGLYRIYKKQRRKFLLQTAPLQLSAPATSP